MCVTYCNIMHNASVIAESTDIVFLQYAVECTLCDNVSNSRCTFYIQRVENDMENAYDEYDRNVHLVYKTNAIVCQYVAFFTNSRFQ